MPHLKDNIKNHSAKALSYTVGILILCAAIAFAIAASVSNKANGSSLDEILWGVPFVIFSAFAILRLSRRGTRWAFSLNLRAPIFIQAAVQISILLFMSFYSDYVDQYAPLILYQTVFAFALDVLLSLYFHNGYRLGGSILPIVFSVNLFMWFRPDYFYFQLAVITIGICSKYAIRRDDAGVRRHIFNPSAIAMTLAILFLIAEGPSRYLYFTEIIASYNRARPEIFVLILVAGFITQGFGRVYLISLGSMLTLFFTSYIALWLTGTPLTNQWIDPSVLVGITLLATDPATSPKTSVGKFNFGVAYGFGIILAYGVLSAFQAPGYFAKILALPVLNLLVPYFDSSVHKLRWRLENQISARLFSQGALYMFVAIVLLVFAHPVRRASLLGKLGGVEWAKRQVR